MLALVSQLEAIAETTRVRAGFGADDVPLATEIALRLLGPSRLVYGAPEMPARLLDGRIVIPKGHPDLNFAVGHELAHLRLRDEDCLPDDHVERERAANYLAAAMLAPPEQVLRARAHFGERLGTMARLFGLSQTATVLRLGEVVGDDRAVVTRSGNVLARGQLFDAKVAIEIARGWARMSGVRRRHLRGGIDEGRIALSLTRH